MTPAQALTLNPSTFRTAIERRVVELSRVLHALTTERTILEGELRLLRAEQKSTLEVKATLMKWQISL